MPGIKKSEMKAMDAKSAESRLKEMRLELMKLGAQVAIGTNIESPGRVKALKRNIARMLTIINSKKNATGKPAAEQVKNPKGGAKRKA